VSRSWRIWLAFAVCLVVVLSALGWISREVLRLDASEAHARRQAALEENVRLALWRMESALTPLVARESARPYFTYAAFYTPERAYAHMFNDFAWDNRLVPSPLAGKPGEYVLLHFQCRPDGGFESPQAPDGEVAALIQSSMADPGSWAAAAERLDELRMRLKRDELLARLPDEPNVGPAGELPGLAQAPGGQAGSEYQSTRSVREYQKRHQLQAAAQHQVQELNVQVESPPDVREGMIRPLWLGGMLVLARRVAIGDRVYVQGCWLDWPAIRTWLTEDIADLLPRAALEPVAEPSVDGRERMLAALPIRLSPGVLASAEAASVSPIRVSLTIVWACVLLAASAVAALLAGAVRLSERRGAFVSAVTHELRTPLTTFRMYAEMLATGMVADEAQRRHYLETLRIEADRLSHLVQNVLSYARLERGRPGGQIEPIGVADLLARVSGRLTERAAQAGMDVCLDPADVDPSARVMGDATAIEQILFNLVDNACKYAARANDRRIHVEVHRAADHVCITVCDHGPGISRHDLRRLFRPFSKSSQQAANSAPGVGLGLALCRRLARDMHGDLRFRGTPDGGACFELRLLAG